jgi:hypothetical protein
MTTKISLEELWKSAASSQRAVRSAPASGLPEAARRYLEHAIAPKTPLASAVRLRMHGEIKLRRWFPFRAEEVIHWARGMIWNATVRMHGIPFRGWDRLVDGEAAMDWRLFGVIPFMKASGPDITRSAVGRVHAEATWLPSVLCDQDVSWAEKDSTHVNACLTAQGHRTEMALTVDDTGRLKAIKLERWGNPEGAEFHNADFAGVVEEEGSFGGYTIPTRLRIGWYFGADRFQSEGEFFRVTIDDAEYR